MPKLARMLLCPSPPNNDFSRPPENDGAYAMPTRGENLWRAGDNVRGIPSSPGYTNPAGPVGYTTDCRPGTNVWIWLYLSYHGSMKSHRTP